MSDLTEEAKAAIAEAVQIVRQDKFEAWLRSREEGPKPGNGPPPPPPKDKPPETPKAKKGLWWGEQLSDPADPPKPPEVPPNA